MIVKRKEKKSKFKGKNTRKSEKSKPVSLLNRQPQLKRTTFFLL